MEEMTHVESHHLASYATRLRSAIQWLAAGVLPLSLLGAPSLAAGVDLSQPIRFELDFGNFEIPYGYLRPRPPLATLSKPNRRYCAHPEIDCFYLIFAMPDGGFSDNDATDALVLSRVVDGYIDLSIQPRYFVMIGPVLPIDYADANRVPERQLQNIRATGVDLASPPGEDGTPHEFFARIFRHSRIKAYYASFMTDTHEPHHISYFMQCNEVNSVPNPLCYGTVALFAFSATSHFSFQARYLDQTRAIFERLDGLLTSWRK